MPPPAIINLCWNIVIRLQWLSYEIWPRLSAVDTIITLYQLRGDSIGRAVCSYGKICRCWVVVWGEIFFIWQSVDMAVRLLIWKEGCYTEVRLERKLSIWKEGCWYGREAFDMEGRLLIWKRGFWYGRGAVRMEGGSLYGIEAVYMEGVWKWFNTIRL